ncbi:unnamed protein product [Arctia plantaginis]|uniref:Ig-like domain-containing protein n=1 Tax=Arctia plantaginis TaxID=874455 RepID=A0A8S0ZY86_ARCPL|nr:unnamed protein product [Arctia plantaginis]CAB3238574.1 unnamed protein product [Arctia plantaginis]
MLCFLTFAILFTGRVHTTVTDDMMMTKTAEKDTKYNNTAFKHLSIYWLSELIHFTRKENVVDISLDRKSFIEVCYIQPPNGTIVEASLFKVEGVTVQHRTDYVSCRITIGPLDDGLVGRWSLCGMSENNGEMRCQPVTITWYNNHGKRNWVATNESSFIHAIQVGGSVKSSISGSGNVTTCHVVTPGGEDLVITTDVKYPHVERGSVMNPLLCSVLLKNITEDMLGNWLIYGKFRSVLQQTEVRLPLTLSLYNEDKPYHQAYNVTVLQSQKHLVQMGTNLSVEVTQETENFVIQDDIYIKEGQDLYLHLYGVVQPSMPETCMLYGPNDTEYTDAVIDPMYTLTCGYMIRNADRTHNGTWVIEYGNKIKRRGSVNVHIINLEELNLDDIYWTVGDSVNMTVGPKGAVYCVIWNYNQILFENFGECRIVLDRVMMHHEGYWSVTVALPGSVRLRNLYDFVVHVRNRDTKPPVTTTVTKSDSSIMLTCSVPVQHEVRACKFRDPRYNVLIAANRVGQDGYMFNGSIANYKSEVQSHNCTLGITNPSVLDLGIWRCALDTSTGMYYGFFTVMVPELMQDPAYAASVVTEPVLKNRSPMHMEGDPVTIQCSVSSALRYCYFRAHNGTVYNVFPTMPHDENYEYIGAGLDAGDCGIRFKKFSVDEAKGWSCHVGLINTTAGELQTKVYADIIAKMTVRHYWRHSSLVVVDARVYNEHALDYCRFVRSDGLGFTSDNLPPGYTMDTSLYRGFCTLYIRNPKIVDLHPWTIAAKPTAFEGEFSKSTTDDILIVEQPQQNSSDILCWVITVTVCSIFVIAAAVLIPKRNRDWISTKTSRLKEIFSSSSHNEIATEKSLLEHRGINDTSKSNIL